MPTLLVRATMIVAALLAAAGRSDGDDIPVVVGVDAEPLTACVKDLLATLSILHRPLPFDAQRKVNAALALADPAARTEAIQRALDPECIADLEIDAKGRMRVGPGPARPVLHRHVWRPFVIKVRNAAKMGANFGISSPSASPEAGFDRWLDLVLSNNGPLDETISGEPVEYRLIRASSRSLGRRKASLEFELVPDAERPPIGGGVELEFTCITPNSSNPDVRDPGDRPTLDEAIAEVERLDPFWMLEDVEARRIVPPPGKNSGDRMIEVHQALPPEWKEAKLAKPGAKGPATLASIWEALAKENANPNRRLSPDLSASIRGVLRPIEPILERARQLESFPGGRYPLKYERITFETLLPNAQNSRTVVRLLQLDVADLAERGDIDGALASSRAILGAARSLGDEPFLVSQLVREALEAVAIEGIERAMALGEAGDGSLAATRDALAVEDEAPLLIDTLRGERAAYVDICEKLATNVIDIKELSGEKPAARPPAGNREIPFYRDSQALGLLLLTREVEIAKRPLHDQMALWDAFERDLKLPTDRIRRARYAVVYLMIPGTRACADAYIRTRALLRCSELAIGLERLRKRNGRWPKPGESLAQILPDGPPIDPFSGKPLRWTETPEGLVVYSVGFDRKDDGGNIDNKKNVRRVAGTDLGVRLYNLNARARPAKPPAEEPRP
jgi:hypothetical protein